MKQIPFYPKLIVGYTIAGAIYLILLDVPIHAMAQQGGHWLETIKDAAFLLITAAALYLILHNQQQNSHHIESRLRSNERSFRALFYKNPQPIWVCDLETRRFLMVNKAATEVYGYSRSEFKRLQLEELYPINQLDLSPFYNAQGTPTATFQECVHQHKDGRLIEVHLHTQPIAFAAREAFIMMALDVTEQRQNARTLDRYRKRLEHLVKQRTRELEEANSELRALTQLKDDFVANVSHELRTPITSMKLHHRLIALKPEQTAKHLAVLEREIDRLARIVDDLLTLSRLDQGRQNFDPEPIAIAEVAAQYTDDRRPIAKQKNLSLDFTAPPDLGIDRIYGDRSLIEQVLGVLLSNAINYTPPEGHVTVSLARKSALTDRYTEPQTFYGIAITDDGPGIPKDEQEKLFERFYRGSITRQNRQPGTGQGLAIAEKIAAQHGGHITVSSTPGQGSTFTLWLPEAVTVSDAQGRTA